MDETLVAPASTVAGRTATTASHVSDNAAGDSGSPQYSSISSVTDAASVPAGGSRSAGSHSHASVQEEEGQEQQSLRDSAVSRHLPDAATSVAESIGGSTVRSVASAAARQGGAAASVTSHPVARSQEEEEEEGDEDQDGYSVEFEDGVQVGDQL